jgi:hypothetical protein
MEDAFGWTVDLVEEDSVLGLNGEDFVLDLISEMELPSPLLTDLTSFAPLEPHSRACSVASNGSRWQSVSRSDHTSLFAASSSTGEPLSLSHLTAANEQIEVIAKSKSRNRHLTRNESIEQDEMPTELRLSETSKLNKRYTMVSKSSNNGHSSVERNSDAIDPRNSNSNQSSANLPNSHETNLHQSGGTLTKRSVSLQELGLATGSVLNDRYFGAQKLTVQSHLSGSEQTLNVHGATRSKAPLVSTRLPTTSKQSSRNSSLRGSCIAEVEEQAKLDHALQNASANASSNESTNECSSGVPCTNLKSCSSSSISSNGSTSAPSRCMPTPSNKHAKPNMTLAELRRSSAHKKLSSAMSDTSEAPSLASHVKKVKLPSHASELDQYLDDLFNPVLDGNLDEFSEVRSLAASIKGDDVELRKETIEADVLNLQDQPEDYSWLPQLNRFSFEHCSSTVTVNQHETNVTQVEPEALQLSRQIKGGYGLNDSRSPSNPSHSAHGADSFRLQSESNILSASQQNLASNYQSNQGDSNLNGSSSMSASTLSLDPNQVIQQHLVQQQMLQRAFLASAVQQNLQIQQQLFQQNQALQQLLQTGPSGSSTNIAANASTLLGQHVSSSTPNLTAAANLNSSTESLPLAALYSMPMLQPLSQLDMLHSLNSPLSTGGGALLNQSTSNSLVNLMSNSTASDDLTTSSFKPEIKLLQTTSINKNGSSNGMTTIYSSKDSDTSGSTAPPPPPLPPPMPLSYSQSQQQPPPQSPIVYGSRAKTVRIGKWRWPPPRTEQSETNESNGVDSADTLPEPVVHSEPSSQSFFEFKMRRQQSKQQQQQVRPSSPVPEPSSSAPAAVPLSHLMHSSSCDDENGKESNLKTAPNVSSPGSSTCSSSAASSTSSHSNEALNESQGRRDPTEMDRTSQMQDASLSIVTTPFALTNRSFSVSSNDLTATGEHVRRNSVGKLRISSEMKAKLELLTINQSVRSTKTASTNGASNGSAGKRGSSAIRGGSLDDVRAIERDATGADSNGRVRKLSEQRKSLLERQLMGNRSGSESPPVPMSTSPGSSNGVARNASPTPIPVCTVAASKQNISRELRERRDELGPHVMNQHALGAVRSTSGLNSLDPFARNGTAVDVESNGHADSSSDQTKNLPEKLNAPYLTYAHVTWRLRVRKELFSPTERFASGAQLTLVFLQVVRDVHSPHCARLSSTERAQLRSLLQQHSLRLDQLLQRPPPPVRVQQTLVQAARQLPLYFARLYPLLRMPGSDLSADPSAFEAHLFAVSHSGFRLVRRITKNSLDQLHVLHTIR